MNEQRRCDRTSDATRKELYDALRRAMTMELYAYYAHHPEWMLDTRSEEKVAMLMRILSRQMEVLNDYDFCRREDVECA